MPDAVPGPLAQGVSRRLLEPFAIIGGFSVLGVLIAYLIGLVRKFLFGHDVAPDDMVAHGAAWGGFVGVFFAVATLPVGVTD